MRNLFISIIDYFVALIKCVIPMDWAIFAPVVAVEVDHAPLDEDLMYKVEHVWYAAHELEGYGPK